MLDPFFEQLDLILFLDYVASVAMSLLILIIALCYPFCFCMNMIALIALHLFVMQSSQSSKLKTEASIIATTKDDFVVATFLLHYIFCSAKK